jgi:hypothetical protein
MMNRELDRISGHIGAQSETESTKDHGEIPRSSILFLQNVIPYSVAVLRVAPCPPCLIRRARSACTEVMR